jgi:hypothetical protein
MLHRSMALIAALSASIPLGSAATHALRALGSLVVSPA